MLETNVKQNQVRAFAPGRTELAGNHTDHQGGRVIAATIDCGVEVVAQATETNRVHVESEGFEPVDLDLDDLEPRQDEQGTTAALVRGTIAGLRGAGVPTCGFAAQVKSTVPAGSGLSSSAAFEIALARAVLALAGPGAEAEVGPVQLAHIAQSAERDWFRKPCGLMDQLAIALGGINLMDFRGMADGSGEIGFEPIPFDFEQAGYALFLVDTRCDHSRYTSEYAQVALDMQAVAAFFGKAGLSQVPESEFLARFAEVRGTLGDLPALRGLHYYHEMALVDARADALRAGDADAFLAATRRSSASSAQYLQNVSVPDRAEQPAMVALAIADHFAGTAGASRIHGGGFGGTIQTFVPLDQADEFAQACDAQLGAGSAKRYRIASKQDES